MASRTSILETIPKVVSSPPKIKPKLTIGTLAKFFLDIRNSTSEHPWLTFGLVVAAIFGGAYWSRGRMHKSRGGFFRLDEKDGLLGHGNGNGKVD
jgi:protein disulfide-isomerase